MIGLKLAADEATHKIIISLVTSGAANPEAAKALAPTIAAHVLNALARCASASTEGNAPIESTREQLEAFIAAIHERTPDGQWIYVKHHPNGDWSVAHTPRPAP